MEVECCGKKRSSNYCPECGNLLVPPHIESLASLKKHCLHKLAESERICRDWEKKDSENSNVTSIQERRLDAAIKRKNTTKQKWAAWVDALEYAIDSLKT